MHDAVDHRTPWPERDHPRLAVVAPGIAPDQRGVPVELDGERQPEAVLDAIRGVLRRVELDRRHLV
jgi:hypothetical protein